MPLSRDSEEDYFKNTSILHFSPQKYLPLGLGVMKFTSSCLLTLQMLHTKFGKDWPSSFWDVNGRRTTHYDNRSPEWLRWPKKCAKFWNSLFHRIKSVSLIKPCKVVQKQGSRIFMKFCGQVSLYLSNVKLHIFSPINL